MLYRCFAVMVWLLATYFEIGEYFAAVLMPWWMRCCRGHAIRRMLTASSLADALSSLFYTGGCFVVMVVLFGGCFTIVSCLFILGVLWFWHAGRCGRLLTSSGSGVCWYADAPFIIVVECSLPFHRLSLIHVIEVCCLELALEALAKALPNIRQC
jgi:hypothetical protein